MTRRQMIKATLAAAAAAALPVPHPATGWKMYFEVAILNDEWIRRIEVKT